MKTIPFLATALILSICLVSCDNQQEVEVPEDNREELQLSTVIGTAELTEVETKAETAFTQKVFDLVVQDNRTSSKFITVTSVATTKDKTTDNKAVVTLAPQLYWDDLGGKSGNLNLAGVFPKDVSLSSGALTWAANTNQSTATNFNGSDLLLSHVASYEYKDKATAANLVFYHVMTKITLNLIGNLYSLEQMDEATVTINGVPVAGTVSLLPTDNKYTYNVASTEDVTPLKGSILNDDNEVAGYTFTALTYPFSGTKDQQIATITIAGNVYNVKLPEAKTFSAGANNVFNVAINKTEVSVTATVVGWDDQTEVDIESKLLFDIENIKITDDNKSEPSEAIITNGSLLHLWIKSDGESSAHTTTYVAKVEENKPVSWGLQGSNKHIYWDDLAKDSDGDYDINTIKAMLILGGATTSGDSIYVSDPTKKLGENIVTKFDLGNFTHPLTKFTVEVTTSDADSPDAIDLSKITSVVFPSGWYTFVINDDKTGVKETTTGLTGTKQADVYKYIAFACPSKTSSTLCTVNVKVDDSNSNAYTVNLKEENTFAASNHYQYTIKITKTNISFTGQVVDWITGENPTEIETGL
ncbi:fimbrillin family protein [Parabacteroides sp. OttesenSCG-928-G07]|nr:fimbrillin family protein [Parabacteroides sp. OttesenSCG-928-G07]